MLPYTIIFEPLSECMLLGACTAWAVNYLFHWDPLGFYLVHILCWFLLDWVLLSIIQVSLAIIHMYRFIIKKKKCLLARRVLYIRLYN